MFLQQGDSDDGRGVERGGDGGRRSGRGRGGRGGRGNGPGSKLNNSTSENVTPYTCVPNEEIVSNKKSDNQLAESSGAMDVIMNLRQTGSAIPRHWIILDSASSPDIFYAEELVKDITKSDTPLKVLSRGGVPYFTGLFKSGLV
jgi:hypothetical protein